MEPIVFDGVGTIQVHGMDGILKYVDDKINKVNFQMQFDWAKVMGGDSGYAFHYTAQDLADKVSLEVPRYSTILTEIGQGGETFTGIVNFDETEEGFLDSTNGYSIKAPLKFGGAFVLNSDSVYLKEDGVLTPLSRTVTAPTATQYAISADGKVTSDASNKNKRIVVVFKWSMQKGTKSGLKGTRKPKPFKFVHRFSLIDDNTGNDVPCQLTIWKALGGGTNDASQERKKATTSTLNLEIMEPGISVENPEGYAAELIFGI